VAQKQGLPPPRVWVDSRVISRSPHVSQVTRVEVPVERIWGELLHNLLWCLAAAEALGETVHDASNSRPGREELEFANPPS
jgi:hypothetical protein